MVQELKTKAEFDATIKENKKVAVDFTATWCGPCRMIGPKFEKLSAEYSDILFVKVIFFSVAWRLQYEILARN